MTTRSTMDEDFAELDKNTTRMTREGKTHEQTTEQVPTTKPPVAKQDFDPAKPLFKKPSEIQVHPQEEEIATPEAPTSVVWKDPKRQKASESRAAKSKKKYGPKKDYSKSYKAIGARARSDAQAKEASGSSGQEGPDDIDIANERIFKALAARRNA